MISKHQHLQSHLSFSYYLKKHTEDSNFIIYDDDKKNEFIPGLFGSKTLIQKKLIKKIKKPGDKVIYRDLDDEMVFVSVLTES